MAEVSIELLKRLFINIIVLLIIVRFIFYPYNSNYKKAFAYFTMGTMVLVSYAQCGCKKYGLFICGAWYFGDQCIG